MALDKKKGIAYGIKYSSLNGVSLILSKIIRGLIIPKLLVPFSYGLFSSVSLFTRYLNFFDFGATAYFTKEVAKLSRDSDPLSFQRLVDQTFSTLVLGIFLSSLVLVVMGLGYTGENQEFYKIAIFLLVPIYGLTKIREFFIYHLYGTGQYRYHALLSTLVNYTHLVLVSFGIYFYSAIGGVIAMLMSEVLMTAIVLWVVDLRPRFHLDTSVLRKIKCYSDQYYLQISETVTATSDQLLLLFVFGPVGFGIYIFGLTFAWIFEALSEVLNNAYYPKVMTASLVSKDRAINVLQQSIFLYLLVSVVAVPGAIVGLTWLISIYFPAYKSGLDMFIIILFFGISRGGLSLLKKGYIAADKEHTFVILSVIAISLNVLFAISVFIAELSLVKTIYFLAAINLVVYFKYYLFLVSSKHMYFYFNIFIVCVIFILLVFTQLHLTNFFSVHSINVALAVTGLIYFLVSGVLIYFREFIERYINHAGANIGG
jgi:O-antigen/teichoic acid export membrane protein